MIHIDSPSMVLNDTRSPLTYSMDVTRSVDATTSIRAMVDMILAGARTAQGGRLQSLILNAHGAPGYLQLGAGLTLATMGPFADINRKVFKIWMNSCLAARIIGPETARQGDAAALQALGITSGNGHEFCSGFARLTGCYIVVSTEVQAHARSSYPHGVMDGFEGLVLSYNPQGQISWQRRYPSVYNINVSAGTARSHSRE